MPTAPQYWGTPPRNCSGSSRSGPFRPRVAGSGAGLQRGTAMRRRAFLKFCDGRCHSRCASEPGTKPGLPGASGALHRRLSGRRSERHPGAADGRMAVAAARPAVRRREPARRLRQHRNRSGGSRPGRRLYAAPGRSGQCDQRIALRQPRFQFPARHRPGRGHHPRAPSHGGAPICTGHDCRRVHRPREGRAGQTQDGVDRQRQLSACVGRVVQDHDPPRPASRALRRRRAGAAKP